MHALIHSHRNEIYNVPKAMESMLVLFELSVKFPKENDAIYYQKTKRKKNQV